METSWLKTLKGEDNYMTEYSDFMYELHKYATQTHALKDKFEKLSAEEKQVVIHAAPEEITNPERIHHPVFQWLENLQNKNSR
ncbi:hypothetical protein [Virgibacillus chiguensis]|nr:hypothetical protein [Virgibacillus chiguensis]